MNATNILTSWLIAGAVATATPVLAQNWRPSSLINASVDFYGVHFTNDQVGYASGTGGSIYKTIDGGLTWTQLDSDATETLFDIYFVDANIGFVAGGNGTIRKTTDAGVNWETQSAAGTETTSFHEIFFVDGDNGYAAGSGGALIATTDGGTTWTFLTSGTSNDIKGLHFISATTGFFVAGGGLIRRTINGGADWATVTIATSEDLNDIYFLDANTGYVCGTGGAVWKTVDTGDNWSPKTQGLGSLELFSIHFASAAIGNVSSHGGWHWLTDDQAEHWISFNLSNSATLNDTYYSSANTGYMVGSSGIVVKYQSELEPEIQADELKFNEVYSTSMRVSYSASLDIPTGYIAIRKTGSAPTSDPTDGITYSVGEELVDGTVVYIGDALSFNQIDLDEGTEYYFKIYAFNGSGAAINYKHSDPLAGSQATYAAGSPWALAFSSSYTYPEDVYFYDANSGATAGGYNLGSTDDGGRNWTSGFPGNGDTYKGVFFVSKAIGYTVGVNSAVRVIRRTVNGGATWVDQVRTTSTYGFDDVWFAGPTTGIAVGGEGQIHRTTNGITWAAVASATSNELHGVTFGTSTIGYAVGDGGTIIKTTTAGSSWMLTPASGIITTARLADVFFTDAETGYIVGEDGLILKTINGGTSWTTQTSGTVEDLNAVHFVDGNTGYCVGMNSTILKTANGGDDWYSFTEGVAGSMDFYGVHFPTPYTGYAAGSFGVESTVYKFQSVPKPVSQPTSLLFSSITSGGLTISFSAPATFADGYLVIRGEGSLPSNAPLDGLEYATGAPFGTGVVAYSGAATSFSDLSLSPGTEYYYQVYAYNFSGAAGSTEYLTIAPLSGNSTTKLVAPTATSASSIGGNEFTANWSSVDNADEYRLDVSSDGFTTFVPGFENMYVGTTSTVITGLSTGVEYSYRVRAINISGPSVNSNVINVLNMPAAPVAFAATSISTSSLTANWSGILSATGYILDISTDGFSTFVPGYHNFSLPVTTLTITGLSPGTVYEYRLRSTNPSGTSGYSSIITTPTLCLPPTTAAAGSISESAFTANWSVVPGADDYRIDVASDPSFSFIVGSYNNQVVAGTSLEVSGLNTGTNYYYRVRASNGSGSSANSGAISVLTLPAGPIANDATSVGSTTFLATWTTVPTATGYKLDVSLANDFSSLLPGYNDQAVLGTSLTVTVPVAGIVYYYRIRAVNASGTSASSSNTKSVLLKPASPVASVATGISAEGFTANWEEASGATSYTLEVSSDNFVTNIPGYDNISLSDLSIAVEGLSEGTAYKYRVRAVNAEWSSAVSNTITLVTTPPAPVVLTASLVTTTGFVARWTAASGAANYRLQVAIGDFSTLVEGYEDVAVTSTSFPVVGLSTGVTYLYHVRAENASGTSEYSEIMIVPTLSLAPVPSESASVSSNGFIASWNPVPGATEYRLDVSAASSFSSYEGAYNNRLVTGTTTAVVGLSEGNTYYYRVRAANASGQSSQSNTISVLLKPAAPVAMTASSLLTNGFTANWQVVAGVTDYLFEASVNDFISNLPGYDNLLVTGNAQQVAGLNAGATYKFRVRAVNASGSSVHSNTMAAVTVPPAPVAQAASQVSTSAFTANWNTTSSVPAYFLDVSATDDFATFLPGLESVPSSTGSQTITGLSAGTTYYYRARAANVSGTSSNSVIVETVTLPLAPLTPAASAITSSGFTATWTAAGGASGYRIDISTDSHFSFYVGSYFNQLVAGTTLPVSGLSPGTFYFYRVRAENESGSSANSEIVAVLTLPGAPVANEALSISSNTFLANWNSVSTATSYNIDVSPASNFSSFVDGYENLSVTSNSANVTVSSAGVTYYYRVRAVSTAGISAASNTVSTLLKPVAPQANPASSISSSEFTASWLAATGATGYYLDISTNNFTTFVAPYDNFLLAGTSLVIGSLTPGTTYQYRVRSYNAGGSSSNSAAIVVVTIPPPPVTIPAASQTTTSFVANWQAARGATSYKLDVATASDFAIGSALTGFSDTSINGTSLLVDGLEAGLTYYYRARAINAAGTSPNSNVTTTTIVPPAPGNLTAASATTSGFALSWNSAPGAENYALDVSANQFVSFVNAYNNLSVTGTSFNVSGLTSGTTYEVRVRAENTSGTSDHSVTVAVQTLPDEPVDQAHGLVFSGFSTSSIMLTFDPAVGAAGYIVLRKVGSATASSPADAVTYNLGAVLGDAAVAYVGSATTFSDGGLEPGVKYFYSIFSYNGSGVHTNYLSTAPLTGSHSTLAASPSLLTASSVGQHAFYVTWLPVTGAERYLLDVSNDEFVTYLEAYHNRDAGDAGSFHVDGLSGGTTYYYRLRAENEAGLSGYSSRQSVLTIPETPGNLVSSAVTSTSFEVSWDAVVGAASYHVDLSTDENFSILAVNNGSSMDPHVTFSGLGNSTKYYARVRASNTSGVSASSAVLSATTLAGGGTASLTIGVPNFNATIKSSPVPVSVSVTGGADPKVVTMYHRKITGSSFEQTPVPPKAGNVFEVNIEAAMADELGVEFYFTATDANSALPVQSDAHYFIYRAIDVASNTAVPFTPATFNGKAATYQMFSIPYELADNNIVNLFEPALDGFSNTRWRLLHYTNGEHLEYPDQLKKIELGQGYWFNTIEPDFQIRLGAATTGEYAEDTPFEMTLVQGWNQIGNPYPFDVDWSAVQDANTASGLSSIWYFEEGTFVKKPTLEAWKGVFVFCEIGGTVVFPLSSRSIAGGREQREAEPDKNAGEWHLPVIMQAGDVRSAFGVGMRLDAKPGKDRYDEIAIPRFLEYVEASSFHPEYFAPRFSTDVVPVSESHTWEFTLDANVTAAMSFSWDNARLAGVEGSVLLLDVNQQVLTDMKKMSEYSFRPAQDQRFKIIMTLPRTDSFESIQLGVAYPNPFIRTIRIPVFVEQENASVNVNIYSIIGQPIRSLNTQAARPGFYELEWDGKADDGSAPAEGIMLYRITIDGLPSTTRRIVKVNQQP
jgi:photosystem II stability/assembly factor-like uncharacterized protein